jgi:hypothetical protein
MIVCAGARCACAFDAVDDARQRRVATQPRHPDVERAAAVDRAGEHIVARRLVDRQRLAGDRRLIDFAVSRDDRAVERNFLARPDDDDRARRDGVDVDAPLAGGVAQQRVGRRQVHQRADGVARALERARLEGLGDGKQEHDRGRLRPFTDQRRAGGGDDHQHVDVERADTDRVPRLAERRAEPGGERGDEAGPRRPQIGVRRRPSGGRPVDAERVERQPEAERGAGDRHQRLAQARPAFGADQRLLVLEPGPHAGVGDGVGDHRCREAGGVVLHVQPLPDHVGGKILEADQVLEAALEQRDLLAAVHPLDLEGRFGVQLADGADRHQARLARDSARSCTCSRPCANRLLM